MALTRGRRGVLTLFATMLALMMFAAACGGSSDDKDSSSGTETDSETKGLTEMTSVTVAVPGAIMNIAPLYLGIQEGIFEKHNLDVTVEILAQGGPAVVPAVVSGDAQFGSVTNASVVSAVAEGIPIKNIGSAAIGRDKGADNTTQILVKKDSPIKDASDLDGKTIGILSLRGIQEIQADAVIDNAGGDWKSVEYLALPPASMAQALNDNQVDAVVVVEPTLTNMLKSGNFRSVAQADYETAPGLPLAVWITSDSYLKSNPAVVRAFQEAIIESQKFASDNPDKLRAVIPTYTQITPEVANEVLIPEWATEQDVESVDEFIAILEKYGFVSNPPKAKDFVTEFPIP